MNILITGGAGFIGSALVRHIIRNTNDKVLNIDKLTYAGNLDSLCEIEKNSRYHFANIDICNRSSLEKIFSKFRPDAVMHLAAESHVDRSIDAPIDFIQTNVIGTYTLLEVSRSYLSDLSVEKKNNFRFHHVSTDEVFGDLKKGKDLFTEETSYKPSSPYSATKASSDHLVRAWHRTFELPILITNCSNNYGPYHFPEKLIPLVILNLIHEKELPIYGDGLQIRDWLYVEDHARALYEVVTKGVIGNTYNIGGHNEKTNIEVVKTICTIFDDISPKKNQARNSFESLVTFVPDRPGHDLRYAIDASKIENELGWKPIETFETGIKKTVEWYLSNEKWWKRVLNGSYNYERLGELDTSCIEDEY